MPPASPIDVWFRNQPRRDRQDFVVVRSDCISVRRAVDDLLRPVSPRNSSAIIILVHRRQCDVADDLVLLNDAAQQVVLPAHRAARVGHAGETAFLALALYRSCK